MTDRKSLSKTNLVIWFTGLSGAGKSTIARLVEQRLRNAAVLDGDSFRQGVSKDLGFSDADRSENNRRAAEVAKLLADSGVLTLAAFVSPFNEDRERARQIIGAKNFVEVFVDCPIKECERRDPKGLYARARSGELAQFTGLTSRFEPPVAPDLHLRTAQMPADEAAARVVEFIASRKSF